MQNIAQIVDLRIRICYFDAEGIRLLLIFRTFQPPKSTQNYFEKSTHLLNT